MIISLGPVHVFKEQSLMNTSSEILFQTLFLSLKLQEISHLESTKHLLI
jgi:hypothetical protein